MALIEVRQLSKRFRVPKKAPGLAGAIGHLFRPSFEDKWALSGVSFSPESGESVAYVGPNGAGKSTTIKILTGITVPTAGDVQVQGLVPQRQRVQNNKGIGVVFGQRTQLWWNLPVIESLRQLGDILLGKVEPAAWVAYLAPAMALLAALIASALWQRGLRQYQGAGS